MKLEAKTIPPCTLAAMRHTGPYGGPGVHKLWLEFNTWCRQQGLTGRRMYGLSLDDPETTERFDCRYDAAVEVDPGFECDHAAVMVQHFPGGRFACTPFTGTSATIGPAWHALQAWALPASGFIERDAPSVELYGPGFMVDEATGVFSCWLCVPIA